jgi:tetratricopeptide (TPR) repeat protein
MDLMTRLFRFVVAHGEMPMAHELARSLLKTHEADSELVAGLNESFSDILQEHERLNPAIDYLGRAYEVWGSLSRREALARCAHKLAKLTSEVGKGGEALQWTDRFLELGADYDATVEVYRLQISILRKSGRREAVADSFKSYLGYIERYSGDASSEYASYSMLLAGFLFESGDYPGCLKMLKQWHERVEDKRMARPFLDANTGVVLFNLGFEDQGRQLLESAYQLIIQDGYEDDYPVAYDEFIANLSVSVGASDKVVPAFYECSFL